MKVILAREAMVLGFECLELHLRTVGTDVYTVGMKLPRNAPFNNTKDHFSIGLTTTVETNKAAS